MNSQIVYDVAREHDRDVRRQVEEHRQARQARQSVLRANLWYRLLLSWFGKQLIRWGARLQMRYGTLESSPDV